VTAGSRKNAKRRSGGHAPPDARDIAMAALLSGALKADAAAEAGVHPSTLSDWLRDGHEFRVEYDRRREEVFAAVEERRQAIDNAAAERLRREIAKAGESGARAASDWLRLRLPKRVEQSGPNGEAMRVEGKLEIEGLKKIARSK
jgi:hypothetical protein